MHDLPGSQAWLHPPQFSGSAWVSTQALTGAEHMWGRGAGHAHAPATHVAPDTHTLPHVPQLSGSLVRSPQLS
jgi:hypothetical protein